MRADPKKARIKWALPCRCVAQAEAPVPYIAGIRVFPLPVNQSLPGNLSPELTRSSRPGACAVPGEKKRRGLTARTAQGSREGSSAMLRCSWDVLSRGTKVKC